MTEFRSTRAGGFTLIELVIVIVLLGILASVTAIILQTPVSMFQAQERRAALTAEADLILTRMTRELRMALPNSVRVSSDGRSLEFIPVRGGGRYRALDTSQPITSLEVFGTTDTFDVGDFLTIFNASSQSGSSANAYVGLNRATITGIAGNTISFASHRFRHASRGAQRFHVIPATGPVTYYCRGGVLRRHDGYGFQAAQPIFISEGVRMSTRIEDCQFRYDSGGLVRNGVVTLRVTLEDAGERISLLHQAQVVNAP